MTTHVIRHADRCAELKAYPGAERILKSVDVLEACAVLRGARPARSLLEAMNRLGWVRVVD